MRMQMVFQTIAHSSFWGLHQRGIPCAASCGSLNVHVAEIGRRSRGRFRCCLVKMGLPGAPGLQGKMNPAFERKNAMVARLRAFSRSDRISYTKRSCLSAESILL